MGYIIQDNNSKLFLSKYVKEEFRLEWNGKYISLVDSSEVLVRDCLIITTKKSATAIKNKLEKHLPRGQDYFTILQVRKHNIYRLLEISEKTKTVEDSLQTELEYINTKLTSLAQDYPLM